MTLSLEKAFERASRLTEAAQNQLAEELLEEIGGELKWDQTLAASQDTLEKLADRAAKAKRDGKVRRGGFDGK